MRNRALHDALRDFALEAAALLLEDQRAGAELEFEVEDDGGGRGPALYRYRALTREFIEERWARLRELPTCADAAEALGTGAASYLRVNGLPGAHAEPALQAMLERLYEDATHFGFPEERFERVYREVEGTLFRDALKTSVLAPLHGVDLEVPKVDLGGGLSIARAETIDAPPEAMPWQGLPGALCVLERYAAPDDRGPDAEAVERFEALVTALRLWRSGAISLGALAWRRSGEGRWQPLALRGGGTPRGEPVTIPEGDAGALREFADAIAQAPRTGTVGWALRRFEMGCSRRVQADALSDYLLALRALLDATTETGLASLPLRLAALCAEDGERRLVQRRTELALSLERFIMSGGSADGEELRDWIGPESPTALIEEMERHVRALLRDVLCGYLEPDLKAVADEILLESTEPIAIEARDMRRERRFERPPQPEPEPEEPAPSPEPEVPPPAASADTAELQGVTSSVDWDDPDDYSAPV
ncbi:MAG TPA: hypothetical protein VHG69_04460 [Thermoleophilaceae bacterium]|nr:hypothetical protein [Thermoleophilaceae bacterium]